LGNRAYDLSTGERVTPVEHPDPRDPRDVRRKRILKQSPKSPLGERPKYYDRFQIMLREHPKTKPPGWLNTLAGQRFKAYCEEESAKLQAQYAGEDEQTAFEQSVKPMIDHAIRTLEQAEADPEIDVPTLETLRANVELARQGRADEYRAADRAYRDSRRAAIEEKAHSHDDIIRRHQAARDQLLRDAWGDESDPVPEIKSDLALLQDAQKQLAELKQSI
jgi:hypothetical protein